MANPGWYPDPQNPAFMRWWDGRQWTGQTQPNVNAAGPPSSSRHAGVFPALPQTGNAFAAVAQNALPSPGLNAEIAAAQQRLDALRRELQSVEDAIEIQSFGFYQPKYGFGSSETYVQRLKSVRDEQKRLIKTGEATHCDTKWVVAGSEAEGRKMIDRMAKLMLRAFNGECDAAIATVRYDNVVKMEQRITKSCEEINKLGHSNRVMITTPYYRSKLDELHLVHEHREKVQEEKAEQKRMRDELKEQEKARAEIEKAKAEAEKEEAQKEKALAKARAELAEANAHAAATTAAQHAKLEALVNKLESELKDAIDRKAKAIARAQLTKSGWVYVLSNVGSFGEGVYKIGLTRRMDPQERVDELGDASVPFEFDIHAIVYSEDAPALEGVLHKEFASKRVNMVNNRKEYFRVTIEEIEVALKKHHGLVSLVKDAEAEEWRKTRAMLDAQAPVSSP